MDAAELQKKIYEGLNAVLAQLNEDSEPLLVGLVEDIRTSMRSEAMGLHRHSRGMTGDTLGRWIDIEIADAE
jgi:hypothetical protein